MFNLLLFDTVPLGPSFPFLKPLQCHVGEMERGLGGYVSKTEKEKERGLRNS